MRCMEQSSIFHRSRLDNFAVLTFAAGAIFTLLGCLVIFNSRLNFDEGYNLQVPSNLIQHGIYGSRTLDGFTILDPYISTGPLFFFPTTLSFFVFGRGVIQARAVAAIFSILALVSLAALGKRQRGYSTAAISILLLFTIWESYYRLNTVMGDGAGIALIWAGLLTLGRYEEARKAPYGLAAGVLWGLSVWAKPSMIMAVIILAVIAAVVYILYQKGYTVKTLAVVFIPAFIIGGLWFAVSILGSAPGASLVDGSPTGLIQEQFDFHLIHNLRANLPSLFSSIAAAVVAASLVNIFRGWRKANALPLTLVMIYTLPLLWVLWWLFFNGGATFRHLFPGLVFGVLSLGLFMTARTRRAGWLMKGAVLLLVLIGSQSAFASIYNYVTRLPQIHQSQQDQRQFSADVAGMDSKAVLTGWGWFQPWDVAFLSNRAFGDITGAAETPENSYLVLSPPISSNQSLFEAAAPFIDRCSDGLILQRGDFSLYRLKEHCPVRLP